MMNSKMDQPTSMDMSTKAGADMNTKTSMDTSSTVTTFPQTGMNRSESRDADTSTDKAASMQITLQRLEQQLDQYGQELHRYTLEQLTRRPSEQEWSLGQMYQHLIAAALYMQMGNIDRCIMQYEHDLQQHNAQPENPPAQSAEQAPQKQSLSAKESTLSEAAALLQSAAEGKTEMGESIFENGSFPPVRVKVPGVPEPAQPESREQLLNGLEQVRIRARELAPQAAAIPARYTEQHPSFGDLNAAEWMVLIEMHYRHHLHQKRRLDEFLNMTVK